MSKIFIWPYIKVYPLTSYCRTKLNCPWLWNFYVFAKASFDFKRSRADKWGLKTTRRTVYKDNPPLLAWNINGNCNWTDNGKDSHNEPWIEYLQVRQGSKTLEKDVLVLEISVPNAVILCDFGGSVDHPNCFFFFAKC